MRLTRLLFPLLLLSCARYGYAGTTVQPGAICSAITPNQSRLFEWRERGLINRNPTLSRWANCPVLRSGSDVDSAPYFDAQILLFREDQAEDAAEVRCVIREYVNGEQVFGDIKSVLLTGDGLSSLGWEGLDLEDPSLSVVSIVCRLPPYVGIYSVNSTSSPLPP